MSALYQLLTRLPPDLLTFFVIVLALAQLVVIVILALTVKRDAKRRLQRPGGLFLVSPLLWGVIVFMTGGYPGALAYWLIHYSTLSPRRND